MDLCNMFIIFVQTLNNIFDEISGFKSLYCLDLA